MTTPFRPPPKSLDGRSARELFAYERTVPNGEPPLPPAGAAPPTDVDLTIADGSSVKVLTTQPSGETDYWPRSPWYDSSGANQIRVVVDDVEVAGAGSARVIVKQKATVGGTFAAPGAGGSEVAASIATTGPQKSSVWTFLDTAAIGDRLWKAFAIGGNGSVSPAVGGVHIQFRQATAVMCPDGGCPLPAGIYNGEDFSAARYADEAAFLAFVEAESDNRYSVWYGDDGSVEGASYDPTLTFCGNPVVVGRWKAVSSGSAIWDIVGFGSFTQFSNPIGDTGGSGSRVSFMDVWATVRMKIEDGWNADDGVGFLVSGLVNGGGGFNGTSNVYIRGGRVVLASQAEGSLPMTTYDLGPASLIVGTAGFVEVTLHGTMGTAAAGLCDIQVEAFINPACSGGAAGAINTATPLATYNATGPVSIGFQPKFFDWDKFNFTSNTAQWPEKKIWVAQWFYSGSLT